MSKGFVSRQSKEFLSLIEYVTSSTESANNHLPASATVVVDKQETTRQILQSATTLTLKSRSQQHLSEESFSLFCISLVKYLSPEKCVRSETDYMIGMKIFRSYVEAVVQQNEENSKNKSIEEFWMGEGWTLNSEEQNQLLSRQNHLVDLGVISLVCEIIAEVSYTSVKQEALWLAIVICFAGNLKAQDEFYRILQKQKMEETTLVDSGGTLGNTGRTKESLKQMRMEQVASKIVHNLAEALEESLAFLSENTERVGNILQRKRDKQPTELAGRSLDFGDEDEKEQPEEMLLTKRYEEKLTTAKKIFKFLQCLCEGHHENLQNLMRDQYDPADQKYSLNVDFVSRTSGYFGAFVKYIRPEVVGLGDMMLNFLIEVVQGPNKLNQMKLAEAKIIDYVRDLMSEFEIEQTYELRGFITPEQKLEPTHIIKKAVKLLISMLEANKNKDVLQYMGANLDQGWFYQTLTQEFVSFMKSQGLDEQQLEKMEIHQVIDRIQVSLFSGPILDAFQVYFLVILLDMQSKQEEQEEELIAASKTNMLSKTHSTLGGGFALVREKAKRGQTVEVKENKKRLETLAIEFFKVNTGQIQIVFRDGELLNIRSPIHPTCRSLDEDAKRRVLEELNRDTAKDKVTDLLNKAPKLFELIDHLANLSNMKFCGMSRVFSNKTLQRSKIATFSITVAINFIIFYFFRKKVSSGSSIEDPRIDANHWSLISLSYLHVIAMLVQLLVWIIVRLQIVLQDGWRDVFQQYRQLAGSKGVGSDLIKQLSFRDKSLAKITYQEKITLLEATHQMLGNTLSLPKIEYFLRTVEILVGNFELRYILLNLTLSGYAALTRQPFFYGVVLFEIVYFFQILQLIMKAIAYNARQILLTATLGSIIVYIFTVIGYVYFSQDYFMSDVGVGEQLCNSLSQCFFHILSLGPRSTGSIGDLMSRISYSTTDKYFLRLFYDFAIWAVVNTIILNLIFGIIIDRFAEMRGKEKAIVKDLKTVCSICSLNRALFDKVINGFETHTEQEHNVWHYVYFLYMLTYKDKTEHDGIESYISDCLQRDDISWMPILRSMSVSNQEQDAEAKEQIFHQKVDKLLKTVKSVGAQFEQEDFTV